MENAAPQPLRSELALNGLEQIFEPENIHESVLNIKPDLSGAANIHEQITCSIDESFELVSMAEAARRMNIPYPTLRRKVLSGKIPSIPSIDGKPLVKLNIREHSENSPQQTEHSPEQNAFSSEYSQTVQALLDELRCEREYSRTLIAKLESATHRNGYLEAQAQNFQEQIKLITDRQRSSGRWSEFWSWLFGKNR